MTFRFEVPGSPVAQGSMVALRSKTTGHVFMKPGNEKKLKHYRKSIQQGAESCGLPLISGPVQVKAIFSMPRPKNHYGTGRNADKLKPLAPQVPTTTPDVDKCLRAVLDSLTGTAFKDDAQVVKAIAEKTYGVPATFVEVKPL